jgi:hypothetical protein
LVDLQKPLVISGAEARVGVQGMGGIGKSVVAAALVRDREVRGSYPAGVIWVSLSQKPEQEDLDKWLVGFQRDVAGTLGSQEIIESELQGRVVLQKLLAAISTRSPIAMRSTSSTATSTGLCLPASKF